MNFFKSKTTELASSITNLQEQYDSLNQTFEDTRNELHTMTERFSTMESEFNRVSEENKDLLNTIEDLKKENLDIVIEATEVDSIAAEKAVDILASVGTDPLSITEDKPEMDVLSTFKSLKGKEQNEFYNTHKKEILASFNR